MSAHLGRGHTAAQTNAESGVRSGEPLLRRKLSPPCAAVAELWIRFPACCVTTVLGIGCPACASRLHAADWCCQPACRVHPRWLQRFPDVPRLTSQQEEVRPADAMCELAGPAACQHTLRCQHVTTTCLRCTAPKLHVASPKSIQSPHGTPLPGCGGSRPAFMPCCVPATMPVPPLPAGQPPVLAGAGAAGCY